MTAIEKVRDEIKGMSKDESIEHVKQCIFYEEMADCNYAFGFVRELEELLKELTNK